MKSLLVLSSYVSCPLFSFSIFFYMFSLFPRLTKMKQSLHAHHKFTGREKGNNSMYNIERNTFNTKTPTNIWATRRAETGQKDGTGTTFFFSEQKDQRREISQRHCMKILNIKNKRWNMTKIQSYLPERKPSLTTTKAWQQQPVVPQTWIFLTMGQCCESSR